MKKSIFDDNVAKYERWFEENYWAYQSELLAVRGQLPDKGEGIEIGVGSGRFAAPLGIKTGVEPSLKMAGLARKKGISVIEANAENLPLSNERFDFALMVTTICFVDDIHISFLEANRILEPNGKFIVGFVDKQSNLGKFYEERKGKSVFYKHANFYSTTEVVSCLKEAGFSNFSFIQTIFSKLEDINNIEPVREGHGKGSFVVVKAEKGNK